MNIVDAMREASEIYKAISVKKVTNELYNTEIIIKQVIANFLIQNKLLEDTINILHKRINELEDSVEDLKMGM